MHLFIQYYFLENSMDYIVHGVTELNTEWLSLFFFFFSQYICLLVSPNSLIKNGHWEVSWVFLSSTSQQGSPESESVSCSVMSSVLGILKARKIEWVAIPFSRGTSWPRNWTLVSCIAGRFFTIWAIRKSNSKLTPGLKKRYFSERHQHEGAFIL